MDFVIRFSPWIVFGIVSGASSWTAGVLAGLVVTAAVAIYTLRTTRSLDVLTVGGVVFFAGLLAVSPMLSDTVQDYYTQAISHGFMALLMWLSLAVRRPFTLAFAKREAPRHLWDNPVFVRTNLVISAIWAACFTVGTIILLSIAAHHTTQGMTIVQIGSIVAPIVLMRRYIENTRREFTNA